LCYESGGLAVAVDPGVCTGVVVGASVVPKTQIDAFLNHVVDIGKPVADLEQQTSDASVLAFMAGR